MLRPLATLMPLLLSSTPSAAAAAAGAAPDLLAWHPLHQLSLLAGSSASGVFAFMDAGGDGGVSGATSQGYQVWLLGVWGGACVCGGVWGGGAWGCVGVFGRCRSRPCRPPARARARGC
jgi:hypothetical protein